MANDVFLRGTTTKGEVSLSGADIGGQLGCEGASFENFGGVALNAQTLRISAGFFFRDVKPVKGRVQLASARIYDFVDGAESWQGCDAVLLVGLTYKLIGGGAAPKTFAGRRDWLAKGSHFEGEFFPQPYTQFARVMRAAGHDAEARAALMERDRQLFAVAEAGDRVACKAAYGGWKTWWKTTKIWFRLHGRKAWGSLNRRIVGYGHRPDYALRWLLGLWLGGTLAYALAYHFGLMVPNSDVVMVSHEWLRAVATHPVAPTAVWMVDPVLASKHYETFFAAIFALDLFLPIVDLGQESAWAVTTTTTAGWVLRVATYGYQLSGWLVTSLGLAAVTGFIQRDTPT